MEQAPSLDMVYMAVSALYNNPNPSEKEKASQWLGNLQKSVYAWKIADDMLQEKRDIESCYFAAQTMRTKIQKSFHELPVESHVSLRDSLLNHISQVNDGTNAVIVMQLCLALADLALQMPSWNQCVLDLVNRLGQSHLWPLLEIMTVLPEELESRTFWLGENRRIEVTEDLKSCAPAVLDFLRACLNVGDNEMINTKIIRCFTSWVAVQAVMLSDVTDNAVVAKAFHILSDNKIVCALHDAAADCVCTLLHCLEDNNNEHTLEMQLYQGVVSLEQAYHLSVANEDQEKSMNYCRIFTELGESFLDKILTSSTPENQHFAIKILDLILICVGHHDYEVAEITFNLWYRLSEELYQKDVQNMTNMFKPYVERLVTALCRHAQMEPDHEGLLEDGDDFKDFRMKVSDLIKDVIFIIGSRNCFRQMFMNLQSPNVTWDTSEAALFVMQAVAKNILPEEDEVVPKVVEAILGLAANTHVAVRYTSVLLLGELSEWINKHPQCLEPILNFLLFSLTQTGVGSAAATALQSISMTCDKHMSKHIPVLMHLLEQVDTLPISNNEVIGLLKGTVSIVNGLGSNELRHVVHQMCALQLRPLAELIANEAGSTAGAATVTTSARGTKSDPVVWLDRLASVFRNLNVKKKEEEHPCRNIVMEAWPILSGAFDKYQGDLRVMESCCRCVRFSLRCTSGDSRHLLEPVAEKMVALYSVHRHSCFLYIGSILVDEYAGDDGCNATLIEMLQALLPPTFNLLKEELGMRNHPDTVDDFFRLCARFQQRAPVPFLRCAVLPLILQCALLACALDHKEANASVMKFFYDLAHTAAKPGPSGDLARSLVRDHGQQLVTNLLHASIFSLHSYMLCDVADVIVELMSVDRDAVGKWLETAVHALPHRSHSGTLHATPQQMLNFHVSVMRSDSAKSVTHALKDFIRLYR